MQAPATSSSAAVAWSGSELPAPGPQVRVQLFGGLRVSVDGRPVEDRAWSEARVEVQHIQSGKRSRFASIAVALAWMSAKAERRTCDEDRARTGREG